MPAVAAMESSNVSTTASCSKRLRGDVSPIAMYATARTHAPYAERIRLIVRGHSLRDRRKEQMMSRTQAFFTMCFHVSIVAILSIATLQVVHAQDTPLEIPANAGANTYGTGWFCDPGYRERDGECKAIEIPPNAYATNKIFGRGWKCNRGYRLTDGSCVQIEVPPNAYLDMNSGRRWRCERGYRVRAQECVPIEVPQNGYLSGNSYDGGWKCNRGYAAVDGDCVSLQLPDNAHIDYSGNDWACDPPYRKRDDGCVLTEEY